MKKHLHYYSQHSQYSEPTDKPAVSYCEQEDEVHYSPIPVIITFTIDSTSYQAEEGMTWEEWCNSSYNTTSLSIIYGMVESSGGEHITDVEENIVFPNTQIKSNGEYEYVL